MCWLMIDKTFPSLNNLLLWWVSGAFPALLAWGRVAPHCSYSICPFPAEAWRNYFNTSEGQLPPKTAGKPSAHLTLRPQSLAQDGELGNPSGRCWVSKMGTGEIKGQGSRTFGWLMGRGVSCSLQDHQAPALQAG